ncbi:MAG: glutamine-hydrolyzing GMP synthase [Clostridiales bacterium]|nr:glutamine-hydrolyzing GMP synthase [Clostridiales bacterium]
MEKLAILDCGGQYTKVIDRKVRELGVYTDIMPMGVAAEKLSGYGAIIFSGGPASVWENGAPEYDDSIFELGIPMLGICYGMQMIVDHFGGNVEPNYKTEYGQIAIKVDSSCPLFADLEPVQKVLMSHGDAVSKMPDGFTLVAQTGDVCAGVYNAARKIIGVQFHPEVDPTENGVKMLENFVRGVCQFKEVYALEDRIQTSINMIRSRVGENGKVVVLVSGGVDSAVTAALLVKALRPDQVYGIHIDHGMMRKNESDIICQNLADLGLTQMQRINAEDDFFNIPLEIDGEKYAPLCETCEPEKKRAIIGHMFFVVTEKAAKELDLDFETAFLGQGTLRPDLIESGNPDVSGYAKKIKTHHNDVGVIRKLRDKGHVIETNWDWHKDEVRQVARMLGLDETIASRQPFPGPGLGVRILCVDGGIHSDADKQAKLDAYNAASGSKYEMAIAPVQSVGVQGDHRSYRSLAILAKNGLDVDWNQLRDDAREVPNNLDFVNRTAYLINRDSIGGEMISRRSRVCHETSELLREVDDIVTSELLVPMPGSKASKIAQCFAVLVPASVGGDRYSIAIRAVVTTDFMTAQSAVPGVDFPADALSNIVKRVNASEVADQIDMLFYDVTGKPPATVEWE